MNQSYSDFLQTKRPKSQFTGISKIPALNPLLKDFQADVVEFSLRAGGCANFSDTGLGKTFMQLEWANVVNKHTNKPSLILTPLAVSAQTQREATKFGIEAKCVRNDDEIINGINIINYESMHKLDLSKFGSVVLDESSILKSFTGITTRKLINSFADFQWKMAATATPAPNDHMELGQHCEFLSKMGSSEMLMRWFIADQSQMGRYRLKGHAVKSYWEWVASWARCIGKPSDLGYSDDGYILPELITEKHIIQADLSEAADGNLFRMPEMSATSIHKEKRITCEARADRVRELVAKKPNETWTIWCDTDYEADELLRQIPQAIDVRGSMSADEKEAKLVAFSTGQQKIIITKPSVAGFGLNWQHCNNVAFIGLSFSYEAYYQAIRRSWRFGQTKPVNCHLVMADTESAILNAIERKKVDHETMKAEMFSAMKRASKPALVKHEYIGAMTPTLPKFLGA